MWGWSTPARSSTSSATPRCSSSRAPSTCPAVTPAASGWSAGAREGGVPQPRRVGEGPHRLADDRGGRGLRRPAARRHDRRADLGQHRRRAGDGRPGQGLQVRLRLPRQGQRGQAQRAQGLRRRGRGLPDGGRARAPRLLLQRLRPPGQPARRLEARPVLQPAQPPLALRGHRPGDLAPDRGPDHPLRVRDGHRRHDLGRRAVPQGAEPRHPGDRCGPGRLGLLRRQRSPVPRRGGR